MSEFARAIFSQVLDQLCHLNRRIEKLGAKMPAICRTNPVVYGSQPLDIGSVMATAVLAAVNYGRQFRSDRELSAWIRCASRQTSTKPPETGGGPRKAAADAVQSHEPGADAGPLCATGLRLLAFRCRLH